MQDAAERILWYLLELPAPAAGGMVYMIMASLDTYGGGVKETCFGAASFFCGCGENGIERLRAGGPLEI